jgi:uncharacterized lipoprotein YmbA
MKTSRRSVVAASLLVIASLAGGCATTGSTGSMQMFTETFDEVWNAALAGVDALGAQRKFASRSSGTIVALMPLPEAGGAVTLSIDVRRTSTDPSLNAGADVQVRARMEQGVELDEELSAELRRIEDEYLELVAEALSAFRRNPRRFP